MNEILSIQCNACRNKMQVKIPKLEQQQQQILYLESLLTIHGIGYNKITKLVSYRQCLHLFHNVDKKHSVDIRV